MIINSIVSSTGPAQREIIFTDITAKDISEEFGVDALSNLSYEQARSLYSIFHDCKNASPEAAKRRIINEDGEIELDRDELGQELYSAMMPEPVDPDRLDPQYSTVEFILKVMNKQDSEKFVRFCEDKPGEIDTSQWKAIMYGASTVLRILFEPPNFAS